MSLNLRTIFSAFLVTFFTLTVFERALAKGDAVNGYKGYKFGTEKNKIRRMKPCSLSPEQKGENGMVILECLDFPWDGSKVNAAFGFVANKLVTVLIHVPIGKALGTMSGLAEKYGPAVTKSTDAEFKLADTPGNSAYMCFASKTVCAQITWFDDEQALILTYQVSDFDERLLQNAKGSVSGSDL